MGAAKPRPSSTSPRTFATAIRDIALHNQLKREKEFSERILDSLVAPDRDHAARHVLEDPLAELLLALELIVERDVAKWPWRGAWRGRRGSRFRGAHTSSRLPAVRRPGSRRARRAPGRGTASTLWSSLSSRTIAGSLSSCTRAGRPCVASQLREPLGRRQADRLDDLGGEAPGGPRPGSRGPRPRPGGAPCASGGRARQSRRGTCRARGQVESGGEGPGELLQHAAERGAVPGLFGARRRCLHRGRDTPRAVRRAREEPQLLLGVAEHALEVGRAEA